MNLHKIELDTPFKIGSVNVYLLTGDVLTLVDVGPKTPIALKMLTYEMEKLGYKISDLEQIVITHAHHDHFGLTKQLVDKSNAKTLIHPKTAPWLENHDFTWRRTLEYFNYLYSIAGVPENIINLINGGDDTFKLNTLAESAPIGKVLKDGEIIRMGSEEWQVIFTPGHSGDSLCLYHEGEKLLLSGDHLLADISSNPLLELPEGDWDIRKSSIQNQLKSLERIAELDILEVLPGHGKNIKDHKQVISERIRQYESRQQEVFSLVDSVPKNPYQVCMDLFPGLDASEMFLGISETIGHLDVLTEKGLIGREIKTDVEVYFSV